MSKEIEKKMNNISDILKKMDRVNETFTYEVWVPSLERPVMFREINTAQQERLLKSIIDSPVYNTEFIFTLKKIIEENCAEDISMSELTIIDKFMIALKMRSVSIGDTIEMKFNVDNVEKPIQRAISIESIIEDAKNKVEIPSGIVVSDDNYELECKVPSIDTEYKMEYELRKHTTRDQARDAEELRKMIGEVFTSEIVKYICKLTIVGEDESTIINMDDITFKQRIDLIGKLPSRLLKEVIEFIGNVNKEIGKITLIKTNVTVTENEEEIEKEVEERLTVDGGFFTSY